MASTRRAADFAVAAIIVGLAAAISPLAIRTATGRLDLSPRIVALSVTFDAILLLLALAVLARGRARRACFHLLAWTLPLALLAALEAGAIAVRLADRIAPLENLSILANKDGWPAALHEPGPQNAQQTACCSTSPGNATASASTSSACAPPRRPRSGRENGGSPSPAARPPGAGACSMPTAFRSCCSRCCIGKATPTSPSTISRSTP